MGKNKQKNLTYKGVQLRHGMLFTASYENIQIKGCFNLEYRLTHSIYLLTCQNTLDGGHNSAELFGYDYGYIVTIKLSNNNPREIINFGTVFTDFKLIKYIEPEIEYEIF